MHLTKDVVDQLYSIMVLTIGTPDISYLRWAFVYAITEVQVTDYQIDSKLGSGARFRNKWKTVAPVIVCGASQSTPERELMTAQVNAAIAEVVRSRRVKR